MYLYLAAEFRRYAEECRQMTRITRNAEDRHYWTTLAERWERCAENVEREPETTRKRNTHRRRDPIEKAA